MSTETSSLRLASLVAALLVVLGGSPGTAAVVGDESMLGQSLVVRTARVVKLSCRPDADAVELPGPADDPTVFGATLSLEDEGGSEAQTFVLPANGWLGLGTPAGSRGYRYRGTSAPGDCSRVIVKSNAVRATCKGAGVTLMPPFVGDARAVLTLGPDSKRYCALFGGTVVRNEPGFLKRKRAPAPSGCSVTTTTTTTASTMPPTSTTPGSCGDGVCFAIFGEHCLNCPRDCGPCGTCNNDDVCEPAAGEQCSECSHDCGFCSCDHDTVCEPGAGELCAFCSDCLPCNACGDGTCASGETCGTCAVDCCP